MSFDNKPLVTMDEFVTHIGLLSGNVPNTDAMLIAAANQVLIGYADRLKQRFQFTLPVPAYGCELDVSDFGINDVTQVEETCGDGCWRPVPWFWEKNHLVLVEPTAYARAIRFEYWAYPPRVAQATNYGTLALAYDPVAGASALLIVPSVPVTAIPSSGYVHLMSGANSLWLEYRSVTEASTSSMNLLYPAQAPWGQQTFVYPIGSTLEWGLGFPSSRVFDAATAQAAAYYWAARTGNCNSEDDRSFATQMMNFWMGEAEKKWKMAPSARKARIIRKRSLDSLLTGAF